MAKAEKETDNGSYHTKYRPQSFDDVFGNDTEIKALQSNIKKGRQHAFLLTGPGGVGKTTLARISAAELDCKSIISQDAATNSGAEAMRAITEMCQPKPLVGGNRALIIDECHGLSKQAWDSILLATEEPPDHLFWFLCTTNPTKVPATIKTRCVEINLKPLREKDMHSILNFVMREEGIKLPAKAADAIVFEAKGSPRQALTMLAKVEDLEDPREISDALKRVIESEPVLELCRYLTKGGKRGWQSAMAILDKIEEATENPEGVRIQVMHYLGKCLKGAKSDGDACYFLATMDAWCVPYNSVEGMAPLLQSIGRTLYAGGEDA